MSSEMSVITEKDLYESGLKRQIILMPPGVDGIRMILCGKGVDISTEDEVWTNIEKFPLIGYVNSKGDVKCYSLTSLKYGFHETSDQVIEDVVAVLVLNNIKTGKFLGE